MEMSHTFYKVNNQICTRICDIVMSDEPIIDLWSQYDRIDYLASFLKIPYRGTLRTLERAVIDFDEETFNDQKSELLAQFDKEYAQYKQPLLESHVHQDS